MAKKMNALVYSSRGLEHTEKEMPVLEKDEVLVKVSKISMCGSEFPWLERRVPFHDLYGITAFHEGGGHAVGIGKDVRGINEGDLVGMDSHRDRPAFDVGEDRYAAVQGLKADIGGKIPDGVGAEYIAVPEKAVFALDPSIEKIWPSCLYEPSGNAFNLCETLIREFKGKAPESLAIAGLGFQGLLMAMVLKEYYGVKTIIGVEKDAGKIEHAVSMGSFEKVYQPGDGNFKVDAWVDTTAVPSAINGAYSYLEKGSNLFLFGFSHRSQAEITFDGKSTRISDIVLNQLSGTSEGINVRGVFGRYRSSWNLSREVIPSLASRGIDLTRLYTDCGNLSALPGMLAPDFGENESLPERIGKYTRGPVIKPVFEAYFGD